MPVRTCICCTDPAYASSLTATVLGADVYARQTTDSHIMIKYSPPTTYSQWLDHIDRGLPRSPQRCVPSSGFDVNDGRRRGKAMGSHTFHPVSVVCRCRREICLVATAVPYRLCGGYLSISQLFLAWASVET